MKRLIVLVASLALAAFTFGCGGSETTENKTTTSTSNTSANGSTATNVNKTTTTTTNTNKVVYNANISEDEYKKDKGTFDQKAKDLGDKIGTGVSDGWLWVKTRGALMSADGLEESKINVDVNNGMIVLRGTVPDQDQVKKADTAAKSVKGSKGVQNQLKADAASNKGMPAKK